MVKKERVPVLILVVLFLAGIPFFVSRLEMTPKGGRSEPVQLQASGVPKTEAENAETHNPSAKEIVLPPAGSVGEQLAQWHQIEPEIIGQPVFPPAPAEGPAETEDGKSRLPRNFLFDIGVEDTTDHKDVRTANYKVGVGYQLTQRQIFGVEARKEFTDPYDADAAGRTPGTEEGVDVKYKLRF